jgi:hypothetical protein
MRILLPIVVLIAFAAVLAGCGSGSEGTTAGTTGANPPATSSTAHPAAPAGASVRACKLGPAVDGPARVAGIPCAGARLLAIGWFKEDKCIGAAGASRTSCRLGHFVCLGARTDRGVAVNCSGPAGSISFTARPPGSE